MRNNDLSTETLNNVIASLWVGGGIFVIGAACFLLAHVTHGKSDVLMALGLKGVALGFGIFTYHCLNMKYWRIPCLITMANVAVWAIIEWPLGTQSLLNPTPQLMILIEGTVGAFLVKWLTSAGERLVPGVIRCWPFWRQSRCGS